MTEGSYRIAGHLVLIRSQFDEVHRLCRDYQSEGDPELVVETNMEEIRKEQEISDRENRLEGLPEIQFSDPALENLAVYRKIARWMINQDTILLHGSAIAVDGNAYLFTAKSGTGKSTHTRLWREVFGDRAVMVNDDKPLLKVQNGEVTVYGTPWNGKHHLGGNISAPLQGVAILKRGQENTIAPAKTEEVLPMLIQQSYRPEDPALMGKVLTSVDTLRKTVPVWELHCNMEQEAALVAYEAMSKGKGTNET